MFDESPNRDSVLWNSMIGGYLKCALFQAARDLFEIIPNRMSVLFWFTGGCPEVIQ